MPEPVPSARRATLDDLDALRAMFAAGAEFSSGWEQRLTEFQLACDANGCVMGALALRIEARHGWVHSEAYAAAADVAGLRELLVQRVEAVARNHGLVRLWTRLTGAAFDRAGFQLAVAADLERLPLSFGGRGEGWLTRRLKDENAAAPSLEQEMDLFFKTQREANQQLLERARVFKVLVWVLLIAFLVATVALLLWAFRGPGLRPTG